MYLVYLKKAMNKFSFISTWPGAASLEEEVLVALIGNPNKQQREIPRPKPSKREKFLTPRLKLWWRKYNWVLQVWCIVFYEKFQLNFKGSKYFCCGDGYVKLKNSRVPQLFHHLFTFKYGGSLDINYNSNGLWPFLFTAIEN